MLCGMWNLPGQGIELVFSALAGRLRTTGPPGKPACIFLNYGLLCSFPRETIQYHSNPSLCPINNATEAEDEQVYEDLQGLLELTPKKKKSVVFIIGDWNAKVGSQEIPGVKGKFALGIQNEAGQRLIEFCQENALVTANIVSKQHKRRHYTWTSPDGQY